MSITQKNGFTKTKKKIQEKGGVIKLVQDLSDKVQQLEIKIKDIERIKQSNKPQNVRNLERKILDLERKMKTSSNSTPQTSSQNNREMKMLNNVINEDLNKIKIKLEKHEDLIKKMLFN